MDVRLETDGGVFIALSERNLRDLLAQYEERRFASLYRMTANGFVRVEVHNDETHYGDRKPGPGSGLIP